MNLVDKIKPEPDNLFLVNPYRNWTEAQEFPVYEGFPGYAGGRDQAMGLNRSERGAGPSGRARRLRVRVRP